MGELLHRGLNHLNWPRAFRHSEDAIKDLTKCAEIQEQHGDQGGKPYYLKVHVALGDACTKAGKYQEAREAWQHGLKVFPDAKELRARLETKDDRRNSATSNPAQFGEAGGYFPDFPG